MINAVREGSSDLYPFTYGPPGKTYLASWQLRSSETCQESETMKARSTRRGWVGPEYRISVSFRAPLDFAFAWCTDYTPEDAGLAGEKYERKIVERTPRRVIFEDLEESKDGWDWSRAVVALRPPNRWHMDGVGNNRDEKADYVLSSLPDGRTRLDLRWRRRPKVADARRRRKAEREASATRAWKRFGDALERDYNRTRRARRHQT